MIRPALCADLPRLRDLLIEMHQRSRYREADVVDEKLAKALLLNAIRRHGSRHDGGTVVFVAEAEGGQVEGFIVGMLDRLYHIGTKLMATDLFWYASEKCPKRDAIALFGAMEDWAAANPAVVTIRPGATDAIGPYQRTELVFKRRRYRQCGVMYEREIAR